MLCKNCGKEIPAVGKFCPYCAAPLQLDSVNDETAAFTPVQPAPQPEPLAGTPIDTTAFDEAMQSAHPTDSADEPTVPPQPAAPVYGQTASQEDATHVFRAAPQQAVPPQTPPPQQPYTRPQVRSTRQTGPSMTYFAPTEHDTPYKKMSTGAKIGIALLIVLLVAAIGVGGWFLVRSRQPDENLTIAEKYMDRGDYADALEYYQLALGEAKDPTAIQSQIDLLSDYLTAKDYADNGDYAQALALLRSLSGRVEAGSALEQSVKDLIANTETAEDDTAFAGDVQTIRQYLTDGKLDQAAALLDTLKAESKLTSDQKKQISDLQQQLSDAQAAQKRQQENEQRAEETRQSFAGRVADLQTFDKQLDTAPTTADMLVATKSSYDKWQALLDDMYSYLETTQSAEAYSTAQKDYDSWTQERETAAADAAAQVQQQAAEQVEENSETATEPATDSADVQQQAELAAMSIRQSYTKTRCQTLLAQM